MSIGEGLLTRAGVTQMQLHHWKAHPNTDNDSGKQHPWTSLHVLQTVQQIQEHPLNNLIWSIPYPIGRLLFLYPGEGPSWILCVSASPDLWCVFPEPVASYKRECFSSEEIGPRQQTSPGRWERWQKKNQSTYQKIARRGWVNEITDASESKSCQVTGNAGCQISEHGGC